MFRLKALLLSLVLLVSACDQFRDYSDDTPGQITVMTSGGFGSAYLDLAPEFETTTALEMVTVRGASSGGQRSSIPVRLEEGEYADVVILAKPSLEELVAAGYVDSDSTVDLGRSSIGAGVQSGTPLPDIGSTAAFVETLLQAESVGYSASTSGTYLTTQLFPMLGISDEIGAKGKQVTGELVGTAVARGDVEIGLAPVSEILPVEGVTLVGLIPEEHQLVQTFSAGITTQTRNVEAARRLIEYLSSESVAPTIAEFGLAPVVYER